MLADTGTRRPFAVPCAASQTHLAVFIGGDLTGGREEAFGFDGSPGIRLGEENSGLTCSIQGGVQFSPDGKRLGVLAFALDAPQGTFAVGRLSLRDFPGNTEQFSANDVTAYALYDDGALILQFYANARGEANAADLRWWDGVSDRVIEQEIAPAADCQFVSGRVLRAGDKVYILLGERCQGRGSNWRLIRADFAGGNRVDLAQGQAGGAYFPYAGTNGLWMMPDGGSMLIAYPNGLNPDVANFARVQFASGQTDLVMAGVVVDQHPPSLPRRFVHNPAGDKLAVVTRDGNGGETLFVYDLTSPGAAPAQLAGGNRSDRIGAIGWSADGARLYYVITGDTNALVYVTFGGASERKIVIRGQFQGLALSADSKFAATSEQNRADQNVFNTLVLIDIEKGSKTEIVRGANGESALQPLAVR